MDEGGTVTETADLIERLAQSRDALREQARTAVGLDAIERAAIFLLVEEIDHGPAAAAHPKYTMLFADERCKETEDHHRTQDAAAQVVTSADLKIQEVLEKVALEHPEELMQDLTAAVYHVANGVTGPDLETERRNYMAARSRLDQALADTEAGPQVRAAVGQIADDHARRAGDLGKTAGARNQQWKAKIDRLIGGRDDTTAQRAAANAISGPEPTGRGHATRTTRAQHHPVVAGRRRSSPVARRHRRRGPDRRGISIHWQQRDVRWDSATSWGLRDREVVAIARSIEVTEGEYVLNPEDGVDVVESIGILR